MHSVSFIFAWLLPRLKILIVIPFCTVFLSIPSVASSNDTTDSDVSYSQLKLFGDVFALVQEKYIKKPDEKKLIEAAINGMLSSLDPHSTYLTPELQKELRTSMRGEFGGLGIVINMKDGPLQIISPIEDTPASRGGLKAGDIISKIGDKTVQGMTMRECIDLMRGPVNSSVVLTIYRKSEDSSFDIRLVRDVIQIESVKWKIDDRVAYIRITQFTEQTDDGLSEALYELAHSGAHEIDGYILDLRNNPGGLLGQAVKTANFFLPRGEIVSTRGKGAKEIQRHNATQGDDISGKPLVVLINEGSASASEIVAGALQDHRRAVIVGSQSFGKGSVQTVQNLSDKRGAIKLTTAMYYTPSGKSIQDKGITPDIKVVQTTNRKNKKGAGQSSDPWQADKADDDGNSDSTKSSNNTQKQENAILGGAQEQEDVVLKFAYDLIRGKVSNKAFPPDSDVR